MTEYPIDDEVVAEALSPVKALLLSLVRTVVPVIVGLLIAGAAKIGVDVDSDQLSALIDSVVVGAYYTLGRLLEQHVSPHFGWLLGAPKQPEYIAA